MRTENMRIAIMRTANMRRISLALLLALLLPCLIACTDSPKNEQGVSGGIGVPPSGIAHMEELDFDDGEIVIAISEFISTEIPLKSTEYIEGPKRMGADKVKNEIFERNRAVASVIDLHPRYVYTDNRYDYIVGDIRTKVNTGGKDAPDVYVDQTYGMIRAQMEGYLMNVYNQQFTSHFDFGDKYKNENGWYNPYMNVFNFASDEKMYLLAGDYFMDVIRMLNLTAVNLSDFKTSFMQEGGTDYLYNTVADGRFTVDQMKAWSDVIFRDDGEKPGVPDKGDTLGIMIYAGGPSAMGMLPSAGISMYKVSDDHKTYTVEQDNRAISTIDRWLSALRSKGAYIMREADVPNDYADLATTFVNGKVLFCTGIQLFQLETEEFKAMEDNKCVLPFPKLLESDPYCVVTHDNARVGGILISSTKFEECTAWLQASALISQDVLDTYYNEALKYKYGTEFGTTIMMDIIYQNISYPRYIVDSAIVSIAGITLDAAKHPTSSNRLTDLNATNTYASNYSAVTVQISEALRIYTNKFNKLR